MRSAAESLRRWTERWHHRPDRAGERLIETQLAFHYLTEEVEQGLRDIDFDEVTVEDRITFVERAVAWQVRRSLQCGRFDLALQLRRFGAERIAKLHERAHGWRPVLLYGVPSSSRRMAERRPSTSL